VKVHPNPLVVYIDVYIGRCNMPDGLRDLIEAERARVMNPPWALEVIGAGETDVATVMVGKVEPVLAHTLVQPLRRPDQ
jgi:hypothetical protein